MLVGGSGGGGRDERGVLGGVLEEGKWPPSCDIVVGVASCLSRA